MNYQAKLKAPFGMLGIRCEGDSITGIEFLSARVKPQPPSTDFAKKVCKQLAAYFANSDFQFDLPIKIASTEHRSKVWQAMRTIPRGEVQTYGVLAARLHSSPRAIGQACGANPIPIVIPCHRVVGKAGLGGFMHRDDDGALNIKRWLLAHEAAAPSPLGGGLGRGL